MPETVVGGRLVRGPEIAIEILSPGASKERRDRHVKLNLYSSRDVQEYGSSIRRTRPLKFIVAEAANWNSPSDCKPPIR
jgi:hypothetical protein